MALKVVSRFRGSRFGTVCRPGLASLLSIGPTRAHFFGMSEWEKHHMTNSQSAATPVRHVKLAECRARIETRPDGVMIVRNVHPLGPYPTRITDRLDHWAVVAPDRTWLAARDAAGNWERITYGEGRSRVRRIAAALLTRGLSAERPIVILSGNSLGHAMLATAALYAGIPYAAIAPAYATVASDFAKLRAVLGVLTPGLAFAADAGPFVRAIRDALPDDVELVVERNAPVDRPSTTLATLEASRDTGDDMGAVDAAHEHVGPDTIAKFLFTSGSTGTPKAVINTQRMLCANVEQATEHFCFWRDEPLVTLDWAPWNHTAGGNHNFNLVLHTGGTLYLDEGKPTPGAIAATVRNLRDISPNWTPDSKETYLWISDLQWQERPIGDG